MEKKMEKNVELENLLFSQMEIVRESGQTNMMDKNGVLYVAIGFDLTELVIALEAMGSNGYGKFLMVDFNNWLADKEE